MDYKYICTFVGGAVVGVGGSAIFFKKHYERICNDQIAEIKAYYLSKEQTPEEEKPVEEIENPKKPDIFEYAGKVLDNNYVSYDTMSKPKQEPKVANIFEQAESNAKDDADIVYISVDEFGEGDYEAVGYTYYAPSHVVEDEDGHILRPEEIASSIGFSCIDKLNQEDIDCVYIRNERTNTEYEVVRLYSEYTPKRNKVEEESDDE